MTFQFSMTPQEREAFQAAYDKGWDAFLEGAFRNDNPFPNADIHREGGIAGYNDCKNQEVWEDFPE